MGKYVNMSNTCWDLNYVSGTVLSIFMNSLIFTIIHDKSVTTIRFALQRRNMRNRAEIISSMVKPRRCQSMGALNPKEFISRVFTLNHHSTTSQESCRVCRPIYLVSISKVRLWYLTTHTRCILTKLTILFICKGSKLIENSKSMLYFYLCLHTLHNAILGRIIPICTPGLYSFRKHELDGHTTGKSCANQWFTATFLIGS